MDKHDLSIEEQLGQFHNAIREYIITLLLFILLCIGSYVIISHYKKKVESEDMYAGQEDAIVYRISLWLCVLTSAVSAAAVMLLPISIISNEVLHLYPNSYYIKWLNSSLINGLWNQVFFFSNLALFILMPFAYFFTEAEGFSGSRKGVCARVKETMIVLFLLAILVQGLFWVASALINDDKYSKQTLFDMWNIYLPYLYSCVSFLGVLVLLLCTPVGFARTFTVMAQLVVKPKFFRDIEEELCTMRLERENILRKIQYKTLGNEISLHLLGFHHTIFTIQQIANGHANSECLQDQLSETEHEIYQLEKRQRVSPLRRNLLFPIVMLILLALTVFSMLLVVHNTLLLLVGIKALPKGAKDAVIGITSLSAFGVFGAVVEILLILYIMSASVVGLYSLPVFCNLKPVSHNTAMDHIIGNCIVILILSSALPILTKTLGITNFDLIGNFGSMDWLGNFYIIFSYNLIFAVCTALCLVTKFTATVRHEIYDRLKTAFRREKRSVSFSASSTINGGVKEE
ncbi:hypothetical protein LOTGIDRAFT_139400 [Lottia gigantea]|uniref:Protein LMBR1L n=1 Tax=Lottia gigantea TaxID=225164 RepID=V4AC99_LOTGI|nr:hypothetical protein LOTGIDRAFT_139400 [Lottia gigantea]ESP01629.1 hypothetical protein LOTGIDRAFT_139400 [Lottia gigantea]